MSKMCSGIGSVSAIFRLVLMSIFIFKSKLALNSVLNTTSISENIILPYYARKRKWIYDDIHIGNEPKVITLEEKAILSYSYDFAVNFLVIQAHTQYHNLTLSNYNGTEANTNSDTAILKRLFLPWRPEPQLNEAFRTLDYVLKPPSDISVQTLVNVEAYSGKAPIPGGCCITCTLQIDPNLVVTSKQYYKSILSFSLANVYDASDCSGRSGSKPNHYRLRYSIYQYFLEEGNLENHELFDGISKMLTPSKVKENGKKVRDWNPQLDRPLVVFDTERGQGIVFNVLILDPKTNAESVYSPVVTYGCSFTAKVDGCDSLGSIANLVLATCGSLFGLFICFFGQRFYRLYILGGGLTLFFFIGFVLLTNYAEWSHDVRMIGGVCIGIAGGFLVYLLWWWTGYRHLVLYICGLPFGHLLTAVVFFTPFGNLHYWKNDVNFWTVFFCMSITIPFVFLICLKAFAILVSSLVGAYGFIVGIDTFIHSSMTYIILNIIMKATVDDFVRYDVPFQTNDYILCSVWSFLTILGVIVQSIRSKGKPVLPDEAPRKRRKREAIRTNRPVAGTISVINNEDSDTLPALVNSRNRTIFSQEDDDEQLPILIESLSSRTNGKQQQPTRYGSNVVC